MTPPPIFHPWLQPKGFLDPFQGEDASVLDAPRSPYLMEMENLIQLFGWSNYRMGLIKSLIEYRKHLKSLGLKDGFQWIDGSFVEHCEESRNAQPKDIDIVTWIPVENVEEFNNITKRMPDHDSVKKELLLDTYFAPCTLGRWLEPGNACYWFGLLGHTRKGEWKGIIQIDLAEHENEGILDGVGA